MKRPSIACLGDEALSRALRAVVANENSSTADVLAHIAEFDARKLYVPAGYPSMFEYCVQELHLSEDAAFLRIRAARAAREFPEILDLVADGRLHLTAVLLVAPHLTPENVAELLAAATHRTKPAIQLLLAERFPRPEVPTTMREISKSRSRSGAPGPGNVNELQLVPERVGGAEFAAAPGSKLTPLSSERVELRTTLRKETQELIEYARALAGYALGPDPMPEMVHRAFMAWVAQLEKQKFAATLRPGPLRSSADPRHVPACVKIGRASCRERV